MTYPNEPAFPMTSEESNRLGAVPGLTKREYYAALAMQGLASQAIFIGSHAERAVEMADALIAELNKPNAPKS